MIAILRKADQEYLDSAIEQVTGMLSKKKEIWANQGQAFENFDIMEDFAVSPLQFALVMCKLKLNRLKTRFWSHMFGSNNGFIHDPDAEDSLIDLASYAILALGILKREKDQQKRDQPDLLKEALTARQQMDQERIDAFVSSQAGRDEIMKLAQEMMKKEMRAKCDPQSDPLHQYCPAGPDVCIMGSPFPPAPPAPPCASKAGEVKLYPNTCVTCGLQSHTGGCWGGPEEHVY